MIAEKNYLIQKLTESGIKKNTIYTSMKRLKQANDIQLAGILVMNEKFERSGSKRTYDQEGQRKRRIKLLNKETKVKVILADSKEENLEEILETFLIKIGKGFDHNENWIDIVIGDADWTEEGDHILKAKVAVEIELTFSSGIYVDRDIKQMSVGNIL